MDGHGIRRRAASGLAVLTLALAGSLAATLSASAQADDATLADARQPGGMDTIMRQLDRTADGSTSAALVGGADGGMACGSPDAPGAGAGGIAGSILCVISVRPDNRPQGAETEDGGDQPAAERRTPTGAETIESILRGVR